MRAMITMLAVLAVSLAVLPLVIHAKVATLVVVFIWAMAAFGLVPGLQSRVVDKARDAPNLASTLNIAGFNLGNAGGAFLGGVVIDQGWGLPAVPARRRPRRRRRHRRRDARAPRAIETTRPDGLPLNSDSTEPPPMSTISAETRGVFVIAVTPFTPDGAIDTASIDSMVDFYFEKGADGLTILGIMGEAPKLTQTEAIEVTRRVLARASGRPVIVGVSAPGFAAIGELTGAVMDLGAAGVMVAPPGSLRTDDQIVAYYGNVVETIGPAVPLVLQDYPLATGVQITPATLGRIFEAHPSIVMLKHEDWPGLAKITELRAAEGPAAAASRSSAATAACSCPRSSAAAPTAR